MALDPTPLIDWAREREAIRIRKEAGEPLPWTADPILAKYRFCNVRREDDRVTVWVRQHIRERFDNDPNLWFMLAIARWINWPDTLAEMIARDDGAWPDADNFSPAALANALTERAGRGDKVFTGAYTINAPTTKGMGKPDYVALDVLGRVWDARARIVEALERQAPFAPTLASVHKLLSAFPAWGDFMTHQVIVDLRFTRYLRDAADVGDWTVAGPGSTRGLNRLSGRKLTAPIDNQQARREMRTIRQAVRDRLGWDLELSDVQGCLCETDKYLRVKNGEGAPRALYVPGRGA